MTRKSTGIAPCPYCEKGYLLPVLHNEVRQGEMGAQVQIVYKCTVCEEMFKY